MVEEPSPPPPAEQSIEGQKDAVLEPESEPGEPAPELAPKTTSESGFVCDCKEWMRSACSGLPFYNEHGGLRYCVLHYPSEEKFADFMQVLNSKLDNKAFDLAGVWFPDGVDFRGYEFEADVNFSEVTISGQVDFSSATFGGNADFSNAKFGGDASFSDATFNGYASFTLATFSGYVAFDSATFCAPTVFQETWFANSNFDHVAFKAQTSFRTASFRGDAYFGHATFTAGADFESTTFKETAYFSNSTFNTGASFFSATFGGRASFFLATFNGPVYFYSVTFNGAVGFDYANLGDAEFNLTVFHARADFRHASFNNSIHFLGSASERRLNGTTTLAPRAFGSDPSLDFQHVRIEHPTRVTFHTLNLRPHWFVNVDPREFVLTDVRWNWDRISIKTEIAALELTEVSSPNRLLAIACGQLAENAETNNRYEEASDFRYWAMDLARRTKWKGWSFWKTDWLHMLYWAVSGYGERIRNALGVLAAVWFVFVLLYTQVGFVPQPASSQAASSATAASMTIEDRVGQPLELSRALTYSFAVMSLQKPEPKPLTGTAQTLVLLETILGPVQAALLALAIRRKFMR